MIEMFDQLRRFAASDAPALLTGESGTGKERVARAMHELSPRRDGPFVAVNCAAIPEGLMESELLGHERGAFSGALRARPGCFELSDGGTLLLDELAEMPVALQPKLLRILEEGKARRVGGAREVHFDVRVLAATNRNPEEAMAAGALREDLYFRVSLCRLQLPALRERDGDLILLAQHFVQEFNRRHDLEIVGLRDDAKAALAAYSWPGNVRELRNVIGRAGILAGTGWIERSHLPKWICEPKDPPETQSGPGIHFPLGLSAAEVDRRYLLATLEAVDQNKSEAARRLGIDVKTIRNKLKRYGID
jgi:DNA-binding NtrC family response regulator